MVGGVGDGGGGGVGGGGGGTLQCSMFCFYTLFLLRLVDKIVLVAKLKMLLATPLKCY